MSTGRPCTTPNQHAGAATLALTPSAATFGGYQAFVLTRHALDVVPTDRSLTRKCELRFSTLPGVRFDRVLILANSCIERAQVLP